MKYINEKKIEIIKNFKKGNFYVAIDFDKTITADNSSDSWDASAKELSAKFKEESIKIYNKYSPIELDYTIPFEEKRNAMKQWYYESIELLYKYNLTEEILKKSIDSSKLIFREGAKEFLKEMYINQIPVVILSAGIGNVIERFLQKNNCYYENISIISNFLSFDKDGKMLQYNGKIIHSLNKTLENNITDEISNKIKNTEYRLLFGDLIEDKKMVPVEKWNKTIFIGFLNKNIEKNYEVYKDNFDIVLTKEEATFKVIKNFYNIPLKK